MDLCGLVLFLLLTLALSEVIHAGIDCLVAGDSCSGDEICSPRLRTLRQCVAGNGSMKLGPGARSQCANAVSALLSSPLHGCQCKRGMKKEKNCLSIYWSLHQSIMHGLNLVESYPYETVHREYDYIRLASLAAESNVGVTTGNRCLDAAKACNVDDLCQKLRTEYVSACIKPTSKSGLCNRPKCNKALRRFFDRIPAHYTHKLLFCPCKDTACAERRRQTIVPSCSYESRDKPNCITQMKICNADYVCRSRLAQFQYDCEPSETAADGCKQGNYGACLLAYTGLIGSTITPNYVDNSTSRVAPWCSCSASGSRKDECDTFMGQFTDNTCLRNALITFESGSNQQPSISLLSTPNSSSTTSSTSAPSTPSTTSSTSAPNSSSTTSSTSAPSTPSTTSSSSTPNASSTTSSSSTPNSSSAPSTPSRISKSSGSSSGHSRRENRITTSPQETTKTMRNFLDTLMPTQALGNKLLMGQSSPSSDSLPNAASPFSLKLQAVVSLLLLLLHLLDIGL